MSMNLKDDILKADADGVDITKNNSLNTDVVKVVRCKDCKYKIKYDSCPSGYEYHLGEWCDNPKNGIMVSLATGFKGHYAMKILDDQHFCSWGERMENE